uniref:Uncharacterized protein n=1 Tax=Rhizophora mucronata TaxID=61149 RepID=A0A2P2QYN2_RHIMU
MRIRYCLLLRLTLPPLYFLDLSMHMTTIARMHLFT